MMNNNVFETIIERAKKIEGKVLVFPEGDDSRVVLAIKKLLRETKTKVVALGDLTVLERLYEKHENLILIDPKQDSEKKSFYAQKLYEIRKNKGLTEDEACSIICDGNYFACVMLLVGDADGVVSGAVTKSADVMRPAFQIIKQKKEVSIASSCFIMEIPESKRDVLGENGLMVLADCAVVPYPDCEGLKSIALSSAETARNICGITPRVSMLSYTSNGKDSKDENVKKIRRAVELTKEADPELLIEGDLQTDASINPDTASRKVPESNLKGKANVLVFPDIFAGNIGYKLIQQFAGVKAVGPIIQGLNKPVNDLSRGADEEEIYLTALITLIQSEG